MDESPHQDLGSAGDVDAIMSNNAGAVVLGFWVGGGRSVEQFAPEFAAVAEDFTAQSVRFCAVRTDTHPQLAEPFHIKSVPTILFAVDGEILDAAVGRMDEARLRKKVEWLLSRQRGDGFFARLFGR